MAESLERANRNGSDKVTEWNNDVSCHRLSFQLSVLRYYMSFSMQPTLVSW